MTSRRLKLDQHGDLPGWEVVGRARHPRDGRAGVLVRHRRTGRYGLAQAGHIRPVPRAWGETQAQRIETAVAVGARIRRRREALGLTQVQAAALADMSQGDWSALERGYQLPGLGRLERVARALKCGVGDLLGST